VRKIKKDFDIRSYQPGLLIIRHEDPDALDTFFSNFDPEEAKRIRAAGYILLGLHDSFSVHNYTNAELKKLGLKKIKGK
jgi:hypothetical protein